MLAVLAATGVGIDTPAGGAAAFTGSTVNLSTWTAQNPFLCRATDEQAADAPTEYFPLNDTGGTAFDASGAHNDGTFQGGVTESVQGICDYTMPNTAVSLDGATGYISTTASFSNPKVFTVEIWFKTTTTRGGRLIGFGNKTTGASASGKVDRHLYMTDAGSVAFGIQQAAAGAYSVISPGTYNDGQWHLADGTFDGSSVMRLYLDGAQVASAAITPAANYSGTWRVGYDDLTGWPSAPSSNFFAGTVDQAAVYPAALGAARILAHYTTPMS